MKNYTLSLGIVGLTAALFITNCTQASKHSIEIIFSVNKNVKLKHLLIGNNKFEITGEKTVKL